MLRIADFAALSVSCRENHSGFSAFRGHAAGLGLQWPDDVLEQVLYDHADNDHFLHDYGDVDLTGVAWKVEALATEDLIDLPTGPSDGDCIDEYADNPDHWISVRRHGVHKGVAQCWETRGTWKRRPILIDRQLLTPARSGLQVWEGRTRVGILKGRRHQGDLVSPRHLVWVGRPH
ncbi:hypothetical protein [Longispora urticae]